MRIGQVAKLTSLTVETIRYYEKLGLIPEAARTRSGYRVFEQDSIRRLRFVGRAQCLGFSLDEIRELLELSTDNSASTDDVRRRASGKLRDIERKIATLVKMRDALRDLTAACCTSGPTRECPILGALEDPGRGSSQDLLA